MDRCFSASPSREAQASLHFERARSQSFCRPEGTQCQLREHVWKRVRLEGWKGRGAAAGLNY
jgi:hypothetical protein